MPLEKLNRRADAPDHKLRGVQHSRAWGPKPKFIYPADNMDLRRRRDQLRPERVRLTALRP